MIDVGAAHREHRNSQYEDRRIHRHQQSPPRALSTRAPPPPRRPAPTQNVINNKPYKNNIDKPTAKWNVSKLSNLLMFDLADDDVCCRLLIWLVQMRPLRAGRKRSCLECIAGSFKVTARLL